MLQWSACAGHWNRRAPDWHKQWARPSTSCSCLWKSSKAFESFFLSSWLNSLMKEWKPKSICSSSVRTHTNGTLRCSPAGTPKCWLWRVFITGSNPPFTSGCRLFTKDRVTGFGRPWTQTRWEAPEPGARRMFTLIKKRREVKKHEKSESKFTAGRYCNRFFFLISEEQLQVRCRERIKEKNRGWRTWWKV